MNLLSDLWKTISEQGIARCQNPEESKTLRIVNQSAVVVALIMLLSAVAVYWLNLSAVHIAFLLSFTLMFSSILLINRYTHFRWGLWSIFVISSLVVFWEASTFGYESHTHYGFILLVLGVVLNLYNYRKQFYWSLASLAFLVILLYSTNFSLFAFSSIPLEVKAQIDQIEFFLLLLIIGVLAHIYAQNQRILVNELKDTRSQLEAQNQMLQKANQELDRFVYSVSHDLRAPIASTLGLVELSEQESDPVVIKKLLKLKKKSLNKLDGFIHELIDFSRNSRIEVQREEIKFQAFLEEVVEANRFSERASKMNIALEVNQSGSFFSDRQRLRMILHNLISNGIRYSNLNQGNPYLKVFATVNKQEAKINVIDNGIGIHQKYLSKIFDMFFRARENDVGSGLGLYIARDAANKLGGQIRVKSHPDEGTIFTVMIPNLSSHPPEKLASSNITNSVPKDTSNQPAEKVTSSR